MNYVKTGFELAIGWYLGKTVFDLLDVASDKLMRRYAPEKYGNTSHPDYPFSREITEEDKAMRTIGFSTD